MSCYSIPEIRQAARRALRQHHHQSYEHLLQESCETANDRQCFDVLLVSSVEDPSLVVGVKQLLEEQSVKVYADRLSAQLFPGSSLDTQRLAQQKRRMRQAKVLLWATDFRLEVSEYVAWMIGFFDGFREQGIAVLPLVESCIQAPERSPLARHYPMVVHQDQLSKIVRDEERTEITLQEFLGHQQVWCSV